MSDDTVIFKILTKDEWDAFQQSGVFTGNPLDVRDGYVHMSYYAQVSKTHTKFFDGKHDNIVLVHVDPTLLDPGTLRPEANAPGGDVYPHIYGTVSIDAVIKTEPIAQFIAP